MKKTLLALSIIVTFIVLLSFTPGSTPQPYQHTPEELAYFSGIMRTPLVPGEWFLTSASCRGCHGHDTLGNSNIDEDGNDVNLVSHWESSMMAMSAKDPFWRAKVNHEILVNPAHEGQLQDKCTSCHAPTGRYNHFYRGLGLYRLTDVINDSLGLDGVNCSGCHTIGPTVGSMYSGEIHPHYLWSISQSIFRTYAIVRRLHSYVWLSHGRIANVFTLSYINYRDGRSCW